MTDEQKERKAYREPDGYVCVPRAWLEEAAQDVELLGIIAIRLRRLQEKSTNHLETIIQKWEERAK
jgi:hypothetical protein